MFARECSVKVPGGQGGQEASRGGLVRARRGAGRRHHHHGLHDGGGAQVLRAHRQRRHRALHHLRLHHLMRECVRL